MYIEGTCKLEEMYRQRVLKGKGKRRSAAADVLERDDQVALRGDWVGTLAVDGKVIVTKYNFLSDMSIIWLATDERTNLAV